MKKNEQKEKRKKRNTVTLYLVGWFDLVGFLSLPRNSCVYWKKRGPTEHMNKRLAFSGFLHLTIMSDAVTFNYDVVLFL